jgi:ABC-type multidrug transport system permease subunit
MRWHAFLQLLLARLRMFYREPVALFWVYGFPTLLAVGLGIAFTGREPPPPAVDVQGTPAETEAVALAKYLNEKGLPAEVHSAEECLDRLSNGKTALYVVPTAKGPRYEYDPARSDSVMALHWVDALLVRKSAPGAPPLDAHRVERPGSRYIDFLMPGLMGLNLMGGGLWGIGFVLVDLRVRKLFKRYMATPMRREDFLLSILTARLVFLAPDMTFLLLVATLGFGVPVRGNPLTLILVILAGAVAFAGIGLLVACRAEKTETVSGLMNLVMLPMWLLSGTFFSAERFPAAMQPFVQALPLTQLNNALREVMLNDLGLHEVAWRLGILAAWGGVTFLLALKWFRWR